MPQPLAGSGQKPPRWMGRDDNGDGRKDTQPDPLDTARLIVLGGSRFMSCSGRLPWMVSCKLEGRSCAMRALNSGACVRDVEGGTLHSGLALTMTRVWHL